MGSRRHVEPFTSISPNIISTRTSVSKVTVTVDEREPMFKHQPENESQSGSSNSPFDALEEEDTEDSFSRRMIREMRERNQEAVENARSARPQAFRKARPRARGRLTMENLERIPLHADIQGLHSSQGSTRSASSGGASITDPPLNVPRDWGRRGKRSSDWLRRITMDPAEQTPKARTTEQVDWLRTASDVPIPSVEDSPLSHRGSARGTPASSLRRQNDSLERIQASELVEDLDLTSASFIASTPAVYPKNNALAEIRQRELEAGLDESESAYATAPIERQHGQNRSNSRIAITRTKLPETARLDGWSHPAEQDIQVAKRALGGQPPNSTSTSGSTEGPPSPISIHKSSHTLGRVDRAITPTIQKSPQRPEHRREDSQDLLRRLSRAASGTPSPGRNFAARSEISLGQPAHRETSEYSAPTGRQAPLAPAREGDVEEATKQQTARELGAARVHQIPLTWESSSAKVTTNLSKQPPTRPSRGENVNKTIISSSTRVESKTPVVTGAWLDTPKLASHQEPPPQASPAKRAAAAALGRPIVPGNTSQPNPPTEPALPSSALAAIVDEARHKLGQPSVEDLGEATINSLEDLMAPHHQDSVLDSEEDTIELRQTVDWQFSRGKATTEAGKLREEDLESARRMTDTVEQMHKDIRRAKKTAEQIESQVRTSISGSTHSQTLQVSCWNCTHLYEALWRQSEELFYTHQGKKKRPTWVGWFVIVLMTWLIAESIMWYVNPYILPEHSLKPVQWDFLPGHHLW
jgi:hypothetical protein